MKVIENKNILVIAAHPDDEILGCGGTLNRFSEEGFDIHILILGEGITARQDVRKPDEVREKIEQLSKQAEVSANIIGAKSVEISNFPDNRFDTIPLLDIVKKVEQKKKDIQPAIVFTHNSHDLNIDHRITSKAVLTACRPLYKESVEKILAFEILSSTEWQVQQSQTVFLPNYFVSLSDKHIETKISAFKSYISEIRAMPHPRSYEAIRTLSRWRGIYSGCKYAEAFEVIRCILPFS